MGLAYRQVGWVRVEQQRALLGLHAAAGASWVTRGLLVALLVQRALLSECYTFWPKKTAKALSLQPSEVFVCLDAAEILSVQSR